MRSDGCNALVFVGTYGLEFGSLRSALRSPASRSFPSATGSGSRQLSELLRAHRGALVLADGDVIAGAINPVDWVESLAPTTVTEAATDPELPAVLLYTSGTTSAPKAVILRHRHLSSYVLSTVELASADDDAAALISVPPYHVAGVANLLSNVYAGRRCVVLPSFTPSAWLDTVRGERVTHALVVPTILARLTEQLDGSPADVPTLRSLAYGGARTPATVLERALVCFPAVDFVHAYGLTETSSTIAVLGPEDHRRALVSADPQDRARLGSVGRPIPGVEVAIRDGSGEALDAGRDGRIWLRGEQISGEYVGAASALDADGWFDTRDRGRLDLEGYLFIEGRDDDTIIRGSENIAPAEVEDVLLRHPAVADAVVVGVPDEEWGQVIAAVVVLGDGSTTVPPDLAGWARAQLRGSRALGRIEAWKALPRTDTGKVILVRARPGRAEPART